jgi:hypothetical protein
MADKCEACGGPGEQSSHFSPRWGGGAKWLCASCFSNSKSRPSPLHLPAQYSGQHCQCNRCGPNNKCLVAGCPSGSN